ncbi:MAG: DUF975 family protein [Clostridiales bacterium]|nr:DUF975 family protein [Clostridiales bacterium]
MWTRAELKENAKKYFKFNYWKMVLAALLLSVIGGDVGASFGGGRSGYSYSTDNTGNMGNMSFAQITQLMSYLTLFIIIFMVIMIAAVMLDIFVFAPLRVGAHRFFVVSHYRKADLGELGFAFTHSYLNVVKTMFLKGLYTALWSLLLVIPGIVKAYEYRMIPYIMAEHPELDSKEAFAVSKQMMTGNKWNAFVLDLSFLGWLILGSVTLGIVSVFWVNPYIYMTDAELYAALKDITYGGGGQYSCPGNDGTYAWNGNGSRF